MSVFSFFHLPRFRVGLGAAAITLCIGLATSSAMASPSPSPEGADDRANTVLAKANPGLPADVLYTMPESVLDLPIKVSDDIRPGTPFLIIDDEGELIVAEGQSDRQEALAEEALREVHSDGFEAMAFRCFTRVVVPVGVKGLVRTSGCAGIIGRDRDTKIVYSVSRDPNSSGAASWQPRGYKMVWKQDPIRPPLKPTYSWHSVEYWASPGGLSNSRSVSKIVVNWGQTAAMAAVRMSSAGIIGWAGSFTP